jgi:hydrogenase maturation protease
MPLERPLMNVSASIHTLIIGIGNPLRSDDGLAWAAVEHLAQANDLDCAVQTVHQLTPELAQQMAEVDFVVMIDASHEGEPGEIRIRPLSRAAHPAPVGTHHTTPEELAALTATLSGHCPPVVLITLTGADFGLGEQLSSIVAGQLPLLCTLVRQVCACGLRIQWQRWAFVIQSQTALACPQRL